MRRSSARASPPLGQAHITGSPDAAGRTAGRLPPGQRSRLSSYQTSLRPSDRPQRNRGGNLVPDTKGHLLPVYVLADESASMTDYAEELNDGLISLLEALRSEPMIAAKVRLSILGFSDDVEVRMALADLRNEEGLPELKIRSTTNYQAVFQDLLTRIPAATLAPSRAADTSCTGPPSSSSATASPATPPGSSRMSGSRTRPRPRQRRTSSRAESESVKARDNPASRHPGTVRLRLYARRGYRRRDSQILRRAHREHRPIRTLPDIREPRTRSGKARRLPHGD